MELCDENVSRYMANAALALRNQRWAAAVYQSVLAMEEQGRLLIFYEAYIDGITIDKDMWQLEIRFCFSNQSI